MSLDSPPIRRLSVSSSSNSASRQEELINAYEAEEERIINTLSRKLEKLREEKIELENALEAESESHVNRLTRELSILRRQQQESQSQSQSQSYSSTSSSPFSAVYASNPASNSYGVGHGRGHSNGSGPGSSYTTSTSTNGANTTIHQGQSQIHTNGQNGLNGGNGIYSPPDPSTTTMLETLIRENEELRHRLASTERNYVHISRLSEIYREELIGHRTRMGKPIDDLIGLSTSDPYSQPTHHRKQRSSIPSISSTSSPTSAFHHTQFAPPPTSTNTTHNGHSNGHLASGITRAARQTQSTPMAIPRTNSNGSSALTAQTSRLHGGGGHFSQSSESMSVISSEGAATPFSASLSESSSDSPFPFSPVDHHHGVPISSSLMSNNTHLTTPSSTESNDAALTMNAGAILGNASHRGLSYPSVPPPSLSSSPNVPYFYEPASRRGSVPSLHSHNGSISGVGSVNGGGGGGQAGRMTGRGRGSRRSSVERGGRVAETGTLVPRSRAGSQSQGQSLLGQTTQPTDIGIPEEEVGSAFAL